MGEHDKIRAMILNLPIAITKSCRTRFTASDQRITVWSIHIFERNGRFKLGLYRTNFRNYFSIEFCIA